MIAKKVCFKNFRNIGEAQIELEPEVNILYGNNAQGKTNALEGIFLCAQGRSYRSVHEKDFIGPLSCEASVSLDYSDSRRDKKLDIRYIGTGRKFCRVNGVPVRKMSEFIGNFRAVLFCPEHLSIVREGPAERRSFLDGAICQMNPEYVASLQRYYSVLAQRNSLISSYYENKEQFYSTIEIWSAQLAAEAEVISGYRAEYTEKLGSLVGMILSDMTGGKEFPILTYRKKMTAKEYVKLLTSNIEREVKAGTTLYGIHKDDIDIELNNLPARSFASQGQQRSIALAMKLSEAELSFRVSGEQPVLLLDDILSELDEIRRDYILHGFGGRQVIITCCDKSTAEGIKGGRIRVEKGSYTKL